MKSGPEISSPLCWSIARTASTRPSCDRWRRSRRTMSLTSPMPLPSTNTRPACTGSARRAPPASISQDAGRPRAGTSPPSASPTDCASRTVLARGGGTRRGPARSSAAAPGAASASARPGWRGRRRAPRRCAAVNTCAPRRYMWLIMLLIDRSLPGMMRDERITASSGSMLHLRRDRHRDAGQRRQRLALAAGGQHGDLLRRQRAPARPTSANRRQRRAQVAELAWRCGCC